MRINNKLNYNILDNLNIEIPALSEDAEGKLKGGFCSVKTFGLRKGGIWVVTALVINVQALIAPVANVLAKVVLEIYARAINVLEINVSVQIV